MQPTLIRLVRALVISSAVVGSPAFAAPKSDAGQKASAKAAQKPVKLELERWRKQLESGSEPDIEGALSEIGDAGSKATAAAPLVDALLTRGASSGVLVKALEVEGALAAPASSNAVAPYVAHRKREIRRAAARALGSTGGPTAVAALRSALASPDPEVRAEAASGLGRLGATAAVEDLFTVLSHDTSEAAVSIALLCAPEQCDRLMALVGKLKFEVLEASFVPLLLRPSSALPNANKLRYIDRLRKLATKPAAAVLQTTLARLPKDENAELRAALVAALKARPIVGDSP